MTNQLPGHLKPLIATLDDLGFYYYVQSRTFDNLMLENQLDDLWNKASNSVSGKDGIIYVGNTNDHESMFLLMINYFLKNDHLKLSFFLKISIVGFIETISGPKNFSKLQSKLNTAEMIPMDIEEVNQAISNKENLTIQPKHINVSNTLIFIGHGRSPLWLILREFLREKGLQCEAFETHTHTSEHIVDILKDFLAKAGFAIIVATAEDETLDGKIRPRQNVVHEIGLFQGKLGFDKVAILKQNGTEDFTNNVGLQYIPFNENDISSTFYHLERYLKKFNLL